MIEVTDERFEQLVDEGFDKIPPALLAHVRNVVVQIEDWHPTNPHVLGLYEGVALTERTSEYSAMLPDFIFIYKEALKACVHSEEELAEQVAITVVHEVAHHFGIDDARLHELGWG